MKIAILGGGVAGISSAIALRQRGFDVSVYERHDVPSNIGAGFVLWPNAVYVLEKLGVLDDIKAFSGCPSKMQRLSSENEDLGTVDIELINKHMGYPSLSILRRDFQNVLLSKLKALGVAIHYAHTVSKVKTRCPGQAEVQFRNGVKITADVIVGADGRMASCARRYVNESSEPVYQGFINWIGVYESDEALFGDFAIADYWGVGERFGVVPVAKHRAYWAGGVASAEIGRRHPAEYKTELRSIFSSWPGAVQKVIEQTPVEHINKVYVHDHNPIRVWHKHNLIMIGDAAHAPLPTSGQGACQALEDAWHLALCLTECPQDLQRAFKRFTERRFEKTTSIIRAGRGFASSLFNRDEAFCAMRNENSKKTDYTEMAKAMARGWSQGLPATA